MKRILSLLLALTLLISLAPAQTASAAVKLNKTKLTLNEGSSYSLKVTGIKGSITWSSDDKNVATVSSRGKVTAVSAGTATITAKVDSKSYACDVIVKEAFNVKKAIENIDAQLDDTGKGIVAVLENNYTFHMSVVATVVYYDASGNMIGKSSNDNYYFEKNRKCAFFFYGPTDSDYNNIPYDTYDINYTVEPVTRMKSSIASIKTKANIGADNVMVEVANSGNQSPEYTKISVVFYKDGNAIYSEYRYAEVKSPGSIDYLEFSFPHDDNYDTIRIDSYEVYVNESYSYTW